MRIRRLDHLVLTVRDIDRTAAFYRDVLGLRVERLGAGRTALHFGRQKLNLHREGRSHPPAAARPTPGSADLCFVTDVPPSELLLRLERSGIAVEEGPVRKVGALGPIESVYFRDPDGNLVEVARYIVEDDDGCAGAGPRRRPAGG